MKAPGTDKSRVVRKSFDSSLVCAFSFSSPSSLSLTRFNPTLEATRATTIRAAGLIGELANYCVKRSGIWASGNEEPRL